MRVEHGAYALALGALAEALSVAEAEELSVAEAEPLAGAEATSSAGRGTMVIPFTVVLPSGEGPTGDGPTDSGEGAAAPFEPLLPSEPLLLSEPLLPSELEEPVPELGAAVAVAVDAPATMDDASSGVTVEVVVVVIAPFVPEPPRTI